MTSIPPAPTRHDSPPAFGPPSIEPSELEDAVARLRAVREAAGARMPDDPADDRLVPDETAELADRLRARRSVGPVAATYSAAHGHALTVADDGAGRRWSLRARTAAVAAVVVIALAVGVAAVALRPRAGVEELAPLDRSVEAVETSAPPSVDPSVAPSDAATVAPSEAASGEGAVVVHVVGRVAKPGLVTLASGARVADALEGAGGPTRTADLASLNLARTVVDGEQIYVPAEGESVPGAAGSTGAREAEAPGSGAAVVDLNTADAVTLDALPGIGPVLAERIVAWRTDNGPFTSVDELTEVSGIGPAVLEKLRESVRV